MAPDFDRPAVADPFAIVGDSAALRQTLDAAARLAGTGLKVLVTGETGVGKDLLARFIHGRSARAAGPFVAINCAGVAESLLESELFGHVRGSFTGAYRDKTGCLELAHLGTVFLDEVGEMSLRMQALLLRFLENGEIQRVGSDDPSRHVDVRVITATHRNLVDMVARGEFREDLFYRINVATVHVPALRERLDDVAALIAHVAARAGGVLTFSDDAMASLNAYRWPGNVRELRNVVEGLTALVGRRQVELRDLPAQITAQPPATRPERRRTIATDLHEALTGGQLRFWDDVQPMFEQRDITRADLRRLIAMGLEASLGSYRGLLQRYGMTQRDHKRLMQFLAAHDCVVEARAFRPSAANLQVPVRARASGRTA